MVTSNITQDKEPPTGEVTQHSAHTYTHTLCHELLKLFTPELHTGTSGDDHSKGCPLTGIVNRDQRNFHT